MKCRYETTRTKEVFIEATLLRVMRESHSTTVDELITQLRDLKKNINSDAPEFDALSAKPEKYPKPTAIAEPKESTENRPAEQKKENISLSPSPSKASTNSLSSSPSTPDQQSNSLLAPTNLSENHLEQKSSQDLIQLNDQPQLSVSDDSTNNDGAQNISEIKATESISPENTQVPPENDPLLQDEPKDEKPGLSRTKQLVSNDEIRGSLEKNPLVKEVCDLFDGKIVDVRG